MTWAPITMRWPAQAIQWMGDLEATQSVVGGELATTATRLAGLASVATTNPGPVDQAAQGVIAAGRGALASQMGEAPACLAVTPFQSGIGQGRGHQRYLSAPNLVQLLASKLAAAPAPIAELYALPILFLATRYDRFAESLARFNALMPVPDLVRAERRALHLAQLEAEKWVMPKAEPLPRWQSLPLERCTITKAARQSMAGQLAVLESYAADSSPMADLAALAARKSAQQQGRNQQLTDLQALLKDGTPDDTMRARLLGPGNPAQLRAELLQLDPPGHEWVLCAGVVLVGSRQGLSFVQELVGL